MTEYLNLRVEERHGDLVNDWFLRFSPVLKNCMKW